MRLAPLRLAALAVLIVACGGDAKISARSPEEVIASAKTAVKGVTSFHFRLQHENGTTPMPLGLQLTTAEGDVVLPDRLTAEVHARAQSVTVGVDVIAVGDKAWITNPFTRRWQLLPNTTARDVADPAALITSVLDGLTDATLAGNGEIEKLPMLRVAGKIDSGALRPAFARAQQGRSVAVELWIGLADGLPYRARISGPIADGEAENIVRQVDLSRFNARVDIQPPE